MQTYNIWYDTTSVWQSVSGGWTNDAYCQITLEKPATGELKTWLEANAVRLPLTGTWVFNSRLTTTDPPLHTDVAFISNGTEFTNINTEGGNLEPVKSYYLFYNDTRVIQDAAYQDWDNEAYRTITFTQPVQYQGNEEFVKWFTANAKPGPMAGKTLNEYTWNEISQISTLDAAAAYGFKVGDAKEVTLNGSVGYGSTARTFSNQKYWVYIIGINHNEAKEGKGIAFQGFKTAQSGGVDIAIVATNYNSTGSGMVMNTTNTNSGGWVGSVAYNTIMPQWKNCFPSDLQSVIKSTTLYTDDVGNASTAASSVKPSTNEVYYLAEYEVFGSNNYANTNETEQQEQYAYYRTGNSKVKWRSDSTGNVAYWWFRSPGCKYNDGFCIIGADSVANDYYAYTSYGSSPCFKV